MNVATNTTDIATNAASIVATDANVATNTAGIATNAASIMTTDANVATNTAGIATNVTDIATNAAGIAVNVGDISTNRTAIASNAGNITANSQRIDLAFSDISSNTNNIMQNSEEIRELTSGLAAVASLPSMYLSPGAKWSASGGVGFYGDEVGVGATIAIRGNDNWAFGGSIATGGDKATGKLQVRYEGF
jgi:hypothetical protein